MVVILSSVKKHSHVNDIWFLVSGRYQLRKRCALGLVVETAIEADSNMLGQNANLNVHVYIILCVTDIAAQSRHIQEPSGLCLHFPEN
jgi:hypothetical protein